MVTTVFLLFSLLFRYTNLAVIYYWSKCICNNDHLVYEGGSTWLYDYIADYETCFQLIQLHRFWWWYNKMECWLVLTGSSQPEHGSGRDDNRTETSACQQHWRWSGKDTDIRRGISSDQGGHRSLWYKGPFHQMFSIYLLQLLASYCYALFGTKK